MPHICAFATLDDDHTPVEEALPRLNDIAERILILQGKSSGSRATFMDDVWAPTKPVAHLAFTYAYFVFLKPHLSDPNWKGSPISEILSPYPSRNTIRQIIDYAEAVRTILPELGSHRFAENETIQFVL